MIERRQAERYRLALPVKLIRRGTQPTSRKGVTRNISTKGVLFTSRAEVGPGERIEYLITLSPGGGSNPPVVLRCIGRVLRLEGGATPRGRAIAATLDRHEFVRENVVAEPPASQE